MFIYDRSVIKTREKLSGLICRNHLINPVKIRKTAKQVPHKFSRYIFFINLEIYNKFLTFKIGYILSYSISSVILDFNQTISIAY